MDGRVPTLFPAVGASTPLAGCPWTVKNVIDDIQYLEKGRSPWLPSVFLTSWW